MYSCCRNTLRGFSLNQKASWGSRRRLRRRCAGEALGVAAGHVAGTHGWLRRGPAVRSHAPRSSIWLGNPRRRSRHALAATTGLRRPHPVTRSIRLALRLHALASKLAGPLRRRRRLALLTPHGGGRIWRCMWLSARASPVRASALPRPSGFPPVPFPGRLDLRSIEEMPGKVGAPRELEATHDCQRRRLGARL